MVKKIFAYVRISTNKSTQKTDRQINAIEKYARENQITIDEIFSDIVSGSIKSNMRPKYSALRSKLRAGDLLIVCDVDRLGRDADDVIKELKELKEKRISVIALDIPYMNDWKSITDNGMYNMIIDILITLKAHIAEQEREKTRNRIIQGLDAAKKKGAKLGRPQSEIPDSFIKEYQKFKNGLYGNINVTQFVKIINVGRSTYYKYEHKLRMHY